MAFEIQRKNSSKIQVEHVGYYSPGPSFSPFWHQVFFPNSKPNEARLVSIVYSNESSTKTLSTLFRVVIQILEKISVGTKAV
jgi:hypothetical protein